MQENALRLTDKLAQYGIIVEEDRDIYHYGFEVLISSVTTVFAILLLGMLTGSLTEVMAYMVAFIPIRFCIGGYHAPTASLCFWASIASVTLTIRIGRLLDPTAIPILIAISLALIYIMAPAIHPNHPHSARRRATLKKRAIIVGIAESVLILLLASIKPEYSIIMTLSFFITSAGMVLSKLCGQSK